MDDKPVSVPSVILPVAISSSTLPSVLPIIEIAESRDIETVKAKIRERYGFDVTSRYAADLINFVEMMLEGDTPNDEQE